MISKEQILPSILIAIDIGAAAVYMSGGDWKKALYWVFAAGLTCTVTF